MTLQLSFRDSDVKVLLDDLVAAAVSVFQVWTSISFNKIGTVELSSTDL